jgi:hypothetical protein
MSTPLASASASTSAASHSSDDVAFRAPLPTPPIDGQDPTPRIRPLLYRMYIACHVLRLGTEARFSALVFLHRFAAAAAILPPKDQQQQPPPEWKWVAAACLFLACKSEEEPRRLRDVINLAHMLLSDNNTTTEPEADGVLCELSIRSDPPPLNEAYWDIKKKIVETEQVVLRWLSFDVSVSHPHRAVILLLEKEEESSRDILHPIAFRRLNDALFHGPALGHLVLELACAAIVLAVEEVKESGICLPQEWWTPYVTEEALQSAKKDLEEATDYLKQCSENSKR